MKVGVIGRGMVGEAIFQGMVHLGHDAKSHDIKFPHSKLENVMDTELVFICVPTVPNEKKECDLRIVRSVIGDLCKLKYEGVMCIKSTVTPGTTTDLICEYKNNRICFCPEFLKERCAYEDFVENNPICIVGTVDVDSFDIVKAAHGDISDMYKMVTPVEAELTKYMQNVYNTLRILFANGFYEVCKTNGVEYDSVLESLLYRKELDSKYMRCNDNLRGPSGPCLVKDTLAFNEYVKKLKLPNTPTIFSSMVEDMKLYPKTVVKGTRTEAEYFGKLLQ